MWHYNTRVLDTGASHFVAQRRSPGPVPLPVSQMQRLVFAGSFSHVLYTIIPTAPAGIFRVLSIGDLVAEPPESWCSSACACVWHIAQSFCTLDPYLTGRQNNPANLHQAFLHVGTENLKSSDALVEKGCKILLLQQKLCLLEGTGVLTHTIPLSCYHTAKPEVTYGGGSK